jgi:hypothetical protein
LPARRRIADGRIWGNFGAVVNRPSPAAARNHFITFREIRDDCTYTWRHTGSVGDYFPIKAIFVRYRNQPAASVEFCAWRERAIIIETMMSAPPRPATAIRLRPVAASALAARSLGANGIRTRILEDVSRFCNGKFHDDASLVVVTVD